MKKKMWKRILALVLVFSLSGCSSTVDGSSQPQNTQATVSEEREDANSANEAGTAFQSSDDTSTEADISSMEKTDTSEPVDGNKANEYGLSEQQMNSFSMLYYLAITAEDIRTEKDNRLALEDIYTSLLNDINPGAVDKTTQDYLKNLRDVIGSYINISVKRDRLQYIYNQAKASAIRSAVPNPLDILAMVNSPDWKKLALSVVYTIMDSYKNYKNSSEAADKEFLMSGWDLDDEETETIRKNRDRAFDYMVDIVREYGIDGKLTLNEEAIENFTEICDIESTREKIRRLKSEYKTYKLLGNYWLELASCYFEVDEYENCLDCVSEYNKLATGIYRKDFNYVQIMPNRISQID